MRHHHPSFPTVSCSDFISRIEHAISIPPRAYQTLRRDITPPYIFKNSISAKIGGRTEHMNELCADRYQLYDIPQMKVQRRSNLMKLYSTIQSTVSISVTISLHFRYTSLESNLRRAYLLTNFGNDFDFSRKFYSILYTVIFFLFQI